jgi:hypothetical protein
MPNSTHKIINYLVLRWLKSLHISVGSEVKQRKLAKEVLGDNMVAELGAFTCKREGGGELIREVPFAYVPNIIRRSTDLIEDHRRCTTLRVTSITYYHILLLQSVRPHHTWRSHS